MDRKLWDSLAPGFEHSVYDIVATDTEGVIPRLVGSVPRKRSGVLVDLGCGIGTFVKRFGDRFKKVVALDFSPAMVERAMARCAGMTNVTWMVGDMARAAAEIGPAADLTVCLNVITSPSSSRRAAMWESVAAVTRPGARALVVVPAVESARLVAEVDERPAPTAAGLVEADGARQKYFARDELEAVAERHALHPEEIAPVHYPWSAEQLSARRVPRRKPFDWVVLATRPA